ncbi:hypothetical protein, partial [Aeromonas hydrophila]|uniref:hypothetical protein n=1 Tax=Aeromonas hydrophila TaxID=644 RepID=UPI0036DA29BB
MNRVLGWTPKRAGGAVFPLPSAALVSQPIYYLDRLILNLSNFELVPHRGDTCFQRILLLFGHIAEEVE